MSCVIGYKDLETNELYLASDSMVSTSNGVFSSKNIKIFEKNGILFGMVGNVKLINTVHYNIEVKSKKDVLEIFESPLHYLNGEFEETFKTAVKESNYMKNDGVSAPVEGIICVGNRMFSLDCDLTVSEYELNNYFAVGTGAQYALGAFGAMYLPNMNPIEIILKALQSAEKFDIYVQSPFVIYKSESNDDETTYTRVH